jgi:hypothetical protein
MDLPPIAFDRIRIRHPWTIAPNGTLLYIASSEGKPLFGMRCAVSNQAEPHFLVLDGDQTGVILFSPNQNEPSLDLSKEISMRAKVTRPPAFSNREKGKLHLVGNEFALCASLNSTIYFVYLAAPRIGISVSVSNQTSSIEIGDMVLVPNQV